MRIELTIEVLQTSALPLGYRAGSFTRAGFINALQVVGGHVPQGLKPAFFQTLNGTAEAVPYPNPIHETSSKTTR